MNVYVSFPDMMQGDKGNKKVNLWITSLKQLIRFFHGIVVLCLYSNMALYNITTFEVGLYVIPPTDLLDTFTETLCVGYDNVTLGFNFIGSRLAPAVPWLIALDPP